MAVISAWSYGRSDLDDVGSHHVHPRQATEDAQQLAAGEAAGLGRPRPRGVRRIQDVDVDRHVDGRIGQSLPDPGDHVPDARGVHLHGAHDREAEALVVDEVLR